MFDKLEYQDNRQITDGMGWIGQVLTRANKFGGSAGIKVKGNLNKIVSVMILDEKGKEIKSNGWSGWDDQKTYNFSKLPKVGQLKLMYWNELVEQEVKF